MGQAGLGGTLITSEELREAARRSIGHGQRSVVCSYEREGLSDSDGRLAKEPVKPPWHLQACGLVAAFEPVSDLHAPALRAVHTD